MPEHWISIGNSEKDQTHSVCWRSVWSIPGLRFCELTLFYRELRVVNGVESKAYDGGAPFPAFQIIHAHNLGHRKDPAGRPRHTARANLLLLGVFVLAF